MANSSAAVNAFIGQRIREIRKEKGASLRDVGGKIHRSFQQVQKYEKGAYQIPASILFRIAKTLETPITDFYPESCHISVREEVKMQS